MTLFFLVIYFAILYFIVKQEMGLLNVLKHHTSKRDYEDIKTKVIAANIILTLAYLLIGSCILGTLIAVVQFMLIPMLLTNYVRKKWGNVKIVGLWSKSTSVPTSVASWLDTRGFR